MKKLILRMQSLRNPVAMAMLALATLLTAVSIMLASMPLHIGGVGQVAIVTPAPQPTPSTPIRPACPVLAPPYYHTYDTGKESEHAFGPPVRSFFDFNATRETFIRRMCGYKDPAVGGDVGGDWALLAALKHEVDGTDLNLRFASINDWAARLDEFMTRVQWDKATPFRSLQRLEVTTLYMVRGTDVRPQVLPGSKAEPPSNYLVLPVLRHDGTTTWLMLRHECGFQPVHPVKPLRIPGLPPL